MHRVLVTGGAGFIGSQLVRRLLELPDIEVLNFDALTYAGLPESLAEIAEHPRYRFIQGDVADIEAMDRAIQDFLPETLFHLAAESHVDRSIEAPDRFVQTNIVGTAVLLKAWLAHRDRLSAADADRLRIIHVSTDEVYGPTPEGEMMKEGAPYAPSSPYSASKAAADHLVHAYQRTYGLQVIITYATNNYGPRQFPEKLIPLIFERLLAGQSAPLYGDGLQERDWLHVDDHCSGLLAAAQRGEPGESYHLGAEDQRTNRSVVEAIGDCLDELQPIETSRRELICHVADRPGHDRRYALNAAKARGQLGWAPAIGFDAGLRQTVEWYLANAEWLAAAHR